jgi:hypothetical protein
MDTGLIEKRDNLAMTEYVTVTITGEERVRYNQTKKMPKAEFDRLDAMLGSDDRKAQQKAQQIIVDLWIDRRDAFDAADFEIDDFVIIKIGYNAELRGASND